MTAYALHQRARQSVTQHNWYASLREINFLRRWISKVHLQLAAHLPLCRWRWQWRHPVHPPARLRRPAWRLAPPPAQGHPRLTRRPTSKPWPSDRRLQPANNGSGPRAMVRTGVHREEHQTAGSMASCAPARQLLLDLNMRTVGLRLVIGLLPFQRLPCTNPLAPLLRLGLQLLSLRRSDLHPMLHCCRPSAHAAPLEYPGDMLGGCATNTRSNSMQIADFCTRQRTTMSVALRSWQADSLP